MGRRFPGQLRSTPSASTTPLRPTTMVSFCCDACQNVFTKPKVERHLMQSSCTTQSVSCIDCGVVFDAVSVRGHTSCITEEEKFGPKDDACTQTFCGVCSLTLNGAVHAVQHYDSKKHRAAVRRKGNSQSNGGGGNGSGEVRDSAKGTDGKGGNKAWTDVKPGADTRSVQERTNGIEGKREAEDGREKKVGKVSGLSGVMKKVLKGAKNQRLKKKYLVKRVAELLGKQTPANLDGLVERKIRKSGRFVVRKERVMLTDSARR